MPVASLLRTAANLDTQLLSGRLHPELADILTFDMVVILSYLGYAILKGR